MLCRQLYASAWVWKVIPMSDVLLFITVASVILAIWTYSHAFRMHNMIERLHPGFNEKMRGTCARLRKMGLKK